MDLDGVRSNFSNSFEVEQKGFSAPTFLTDIKVGFSTIKECPPDLAKRIGVKEGKSYVSLFTFYIPNDELENGAAKKKLIARASFLKGKIGDKEFAYDDKDIKKKAHAPLSVSNIEDYFYDTDSNTFYKKSERVTAGQIFQEILSDHLKPTRAKGFWLRIRLRLVSFKVWFFLTAVPFLLKKLLFVTTGIRFSYVFLKRPDLAEATNKPNRIQPKTIDFFGYKARVLTVGIYAFFHLLVFFIFYRINYRPDWLLMIFRSSFLTMMYTVLSFGLLELIVERLGGGSYATKLIGIITRVEDYGMRLAFRPIKI